LDKIKEGMVENADLRSFAQELKVDEAGTAGEFTVMLGNPFLLNEIPVDLYPFVLISLGSESGRKDDSPGTMISRNIVLNTGFLDNDTERGTRRSVTLEELIVRVVERLMRGWFIGPNNNDGLIWAFEIGSVVSDSDINRPFIHREVPVNVTYTIE
jgi:hypothetical protein